MKTTQPRLGYYEFLDESTPLGLYSFHWPVARGDWWYPNISIHNALFEYKPIGRREYERGDLVNVLVSNALDYHRNPVPWRHRISFWGGDDFCLSMHDAGQFMTTAETKRFLLALPNPVSQDWVRGLQHDGKPLFQSG